MTLKKMENAMEKDDKKHCTTLTTLMLVKPVQLSSVHIFYQFRVECDIIIDKYYHLQAVLVVDMCSYV